MFETCVCGYDDDGDTKHTWHTTHRARVAHECIECWETIPPGSIYHRYTWVGYSGWSKSDVCSRCEAIRDDLCPCALIGGLYEEIESQYDMRPDEAPEDDDGC